MLCRRCYAEAEPGRIPVVPRQEAQTDQCCNCGLPADVPYRAEPHRYYCGGEHAQAG